MTSDTKQTVEFCMELKKKLCNEWGKLGVIFRSVANVQPTPGNEVRFFQVVVQDDGTKITTQVSFNDYLALDSEIQEKNCFRTCREFIGTCDANPMLPPTSGCYLPKCCTDKIKRPIVFHSKNQCNLDMMGSNPSFTFEKNNHDYSGIMPLPSRNIKVRSQKKVSNCLEENKETLKELEKLQEQLEEEKGALMNAYNIESRLSLSVFFEKSLLLDQESGENVLNTNKTLQEIHEKIKEIEQKLYENRKKIKEISNNKYVFDYVNKKAPGDRICGVINPEEPNTFKYWFICSDAFFRFYRWIMHVDNPHPMSLKEDKFDNLTNLLSGNTKLCTATQKRYLILIDEIKKTYPHLVDNTKEKWIDKFENVINLLVSNIQSKCYDNMTEDQKKYQKLEDRKIIQRITMVLENLDEYTLYYHLRYEPVAQKYSHIYSALAYMITHLKPLPKNAPSPIDNISISWDIPQWLK